jgi:hypothetical protein
MCVFLPAQTHTQTHAYISVKALCVWPHTHKADTRTLPLHYYLQREREKARDRARERERERSCQAGDTGHIDHTRTSCTHMNVCREREVDKSRRERSWQAGDTRCTHINVCATLTHKRVCNTNTLRLHYSLQIGHYYCKFDKQIWHTTIHIYYYIFITCKMTMLSTD